jgi:hypothetical protein
MATAGTQHLTTASKPTSKRLHAEWFCASGIRKAMKHAGRTAADEASPTFTNLHQASPSFTKLHSSSPTFTNLHQPSPSCGPPVKEAL